jgi:hypothetical protein
MPLEYKEIVPWGRNYDEYVRMFDLREQDLQMRILGCGDGPASFNCESHRLGGKTVSVDPLYQYTAGVIRQRIRETYSDVLRQTKANRDKFRWDVIPTVEELGRIRMKAMNVFLADYMAPGRDGRYIAGALPSLPFNDQQFDIALSSHFLFLYSDHLSEAFHQAAIREMLRVSREARIFPVLDMTGQRSHYVSKIINFFQEYELEIRRVNYEFQRGGNEVLIMKNN